MFDWLFRRPPAPSRPFLRFGLTLLEARRTGTVAASAAPFDEGIRRRARGGGGDRSWEHLAGWSGLRMVSSARADLGARESHAFELPEGHRIVVRFEELEKSGLLKLSIDLYTRGVHRSSALSHSKPGTEPYRVLDWSQPERALVVVERHDLER